MRVNGNLLEQATGRQAVNLLVTLIMLHTQFVSARQQNQMFKSVFFISGIIILSGHPRVFSVRECLRNDVVQHFHPIYFRY